MNSATLVQKQEEFESGEIDRYRTFHNNASRHLYVWYMDQNGDLQSLPLVIFQKLTPWSITLLVKLTVPQLIKNVSAYGNRRFITVFTKPHH
jgi:hypothetical protein